MAGPELPRVTGFSEKQNAAISEWLNPDVVEICQDGAARSGKTFHSIRAIIDRAVNAAGSRHLISRLRFNHMRLSVWRQTIFDPTPVTGEAAERLRVPDGTRVPFLDTIVPPEYYSVNRVDHIITFWNGSEILGAGLDSAERVQKIMGTEFCTVFINEATQISFETYQKLKTRIVQSIPGISNKLVIDCNPLNEYHWIFQYFHLGNDPESGESLPDKVLKRCHQRTWVPADNPSLRPADLEILESLVGTEYQRLYKGQWVNREGLVYPGWSGAIVEPFPIPESWPVVAAVDFGFTNPFAFGWFAYDKSNEIWYLFDEYYVAEKTVAKHCAELRYGPLICPQENVANGEYIRRETIPNWIVADHDAEDRATMAENGFPTKGADKDIASGIQAVTRLIEATQGLRLRIFRTCTNANTEAALYRWPETKDQKNANEAPLAVRDHMMDLVRYFAKEVLPTRGVLVTRSANPRPAGASSMANRPQNLRPRVPGRLRGPTGGA